MTLAFETRSLRKEFGRKTAVADLTLAVRQGEVFGFLGPNGAGKTTSVKMLLGLVAPTAGEAVVLGAPLGSVAARARIGFLPEHFRFQDWLTGREFLSFHGRLYHMPRPRLHARIQELLERVDLADAAERKLREYSKGMLQRIGLAMALLNRPALVFLDEPTSGLDPLGRLLVRDIIQELRAGGTGVFLNSHLLSEVEVTCDRVAFVKLGRVVREMTLTDGQPGGTGQVEVAMKLGSAPRPVLDALSQFGRAVTSNNGEVRLHTDSEERIPEINRWLVGQGIPVYKIGATRPSLESIFLEVMGEDTRAG
jgi:ABC-2 type transport system ATP-binding protein